MLSIDTNTMTIAVTRGDTANIVFSAVQSDGTPYVPVTGDKLKFSVAKKVGAEPMGTVETVKTATNTIDAFWTIVIGGAFWYEKDAEGNVSDPPVDLFKFKDYVWDVQLTSSTGQVDTIIGATDDVQPTFRVLGEVATE